MYVAPHDAVVVADVTCAEAPVPLARSPKLQLSHCVGAVPATPQPVESALHEMPEPPGRASVSVTPYAVPVPVLFTQMVKPMSWPALTLVASAFFTMPRSGHCTVTFASAMTTPWFVAFALATL